MAVKDNLSRNIFEEDGTSSTINAMDLLLTFSINAKYFNTALFADNSSNTETVYYCICRKRLSRAIVLRHASWQCSFRHFGGSQWSLVGLKDLQPSSIL